MKARRWVWVLWATGTIWAGAVLPRVALAAKYEVWYPGRSIYVRLKIGQVTAVVLPSEPVSLPNPDPQAINVERQRDHVLIKALSEFQGRMFVEDEEGRVIPLALETVEGQEDDIVRVQTADGSPTIGPSLEHPGRPMVDLFIAMRKNLERPGYTVIQHKGEVVYSDTQVMMRLLKSYEGPSLIGYVVSIDNIGAEPTFIAPEQIKRQGALRGMIAMSIAEDYLAPALPEKSVEEQTGMVRSTVGYIIINGEFAKSFEKREMERKTVGTRKEGKP